MSYQFIADFSDIIDSQPTRVWIKSQLISCANIMIMMMTRTTIFIIGSVTMSVSTGKTLKNNEIDSLSKILNYTIDGMHPVKKLV